MPFSVQKVIKDAHSDGIWSCSYTKRNRLITGSVDDTIKIWNLENETSSILTGHQLGIVSVVSSPSGTSILV
jgi:WD40 repeat protein